MSDPLFDFVNENAGEKDPVLDIANKPDNSSVLKTAQSLGEKTPPDTALKVISDNKKTGLPMDLLAKQPATRQMVSAENVADTSPELAKYMSKSPYHASAIDPDAKAYQDFEKKATLYDNLKD